MQPKHSAIVAGLTLALSFGAVAAPATAIAEEPTPGVASDATDIDKGLYTQQSFSGVLRSVQGVSFVSVTDEMKYFTKYESHGNYNQGFSYGDCYNALGYYQFDRRWSLIPFMKQVYNYDSAKYGMLKAAIDRGSEISNGSNPMYANGQLTELGRIAQDAFLGAYNTDPAEFSALQDAYAYNSYYAVTESWLKNALGIDISGRADCVKGMVWSITNMCGTGGCQDFFRWANLSNSMTDREFVTALSNSVVDNVRASIRVSLSTMMDGRIAIRTSSRTAWSTLLRTRLLLRRRLRSPIRSRSPRPRLARTRSPLRLLGQRWKPIAIRTMATRRVRLRLVLATMVPLMAGLLRVERSLLVVQPAVLSLDRLAVPFLARPIAAPLMAPPMLARALALIPTRPRTPMSAIRRPRTSPPLSSRLAP